MGRTNWKLTEREAAALDTEVGRNAYHQAKLDGKSEQEARDDALNAYAERCPRCGGSGVRCCEFGADR